MSVIGPGKKAVGKLTDLRVIADGQGDKRDLVVSGILVEALSVLAKSLG